MRLTIILCCAAMAAWPQVGANTLRPEKPLDPLYAAIEENYEGMVAMCGYPCASGIPGCAQEWTVAAEFLAEQGYFNLHTGKQHGYGLPLGMSPCPGAFEHGRVFDVDDSAWTGHDVRPATYRVTVCCEEVSDLHVSWNTDWSWFAGDLYNRDYNVWLEERPWLWVRNCSYTIEK